MTQRETKPCPPLRNRTFSEEIEGYLAGTNRQASKTLRLELENQELRKRLSEREQELQAALEDLRNR